MLGGMDRTDEQYDAHLVVNQFIQVLDENVALSSLAEGGVPLRPHDAASRVSLATRNPINRNQRTRLGS